MKLTVLHLADLHYQNSKMKVLSIVVASLLRDLATLKDKYQIQPDLVFFTGDLINRGENGKTEFDSARTHFITPLLKHLDLAENRFFLVPGNHEVDWTKVSDTFEKGIAAKLTDQDSFNGYYQNLRPDAEDSKIIRRKFHLFHAFGRKLRSDAVGSTPFYDAYRLSIKGLNLGILGFNTAWRSSNIGSDEKRLILGEAVFFDALRHIQNCDLKIGLAHHGFDMLTPWDSTSIKLAMAKNLDVLWAYSRFRVFIRTANIRKPICIYMRVALCWTD